MASNHLYTFITSPKTKLIHFQIYLYKISFLEIALEQSYYLSSDIYSASEGVELNWFLEIIFHQSHVYFPKHENWKESFIIKWLFSELLIKISKGVPKLSK